MDNGQTSRIKKCGLCGENPQLTEESTDQRWIPSTNTLASSLCCWPASVLHKQSCDRWNQALQSVNLADKRRNNTSWLRQNVVLTSWWRYHYVMCPLDTLMWRQSNGDSLKVTVSQWEMDGYPWWRHHMETFSVLLALCEGNPSVTGGFPSQRPVTRSFAIFFDLRLNKSLCIQSKGRWFDTRLHSLWRHCSGWRMTSRKTKCCYEASFVVTSGKIGYQNDSLLRRWWRQSWTQDTFAFQWQCPSPTVGQP